MREEQSSPEVPPAAPIAVVAGHICLDIIPSIQTNAALGGQLVMPGKLSHIGPALLSTGGAVSNTGLALHRLGIETRLIGKIGDDLFGRAILETLRRRDERLAQQMIIDPSCPTSYTLVLSAPGIDRAFLHCAGANDTFCAAEIDLRDIEDATLFHFGYPPIMQGFYRDGGLQLANLLKQVKAMGITTSLDTAHVDVDAAAGQVDWRQYLERVLPYVDFFLPSVDEIAFMLEGQRMGPSDSVVGIGTIESGVDAEFLRRSTSTLVEMGVAVAGIKLGEKGIYLRTSGDPKRVGGTGRVQLPREWLDRTLFSPALQVEVAGTTGAGDCAVAGFLAAVLRGQGPEEALIAAVAAGACNVESADAISGIPTWEEMHVRLDQGWPRREQAILLPGWRWDANSMFWHGPKDALTS